jgi:tetratricopeptide (TPR) repeat protein
MLSFPFCLLLASASVALAAAPTAPSEAKPDRSRLDGEVPPSFSVGIELPPTDDEKAYRRLLQIDDEAAEVIDTLIREADAKGQQTDAAGLQTKVDAQIAKVDAAYKEFFGKYPDHSRARIAFGSFLNDTGREFEAREQWERAARLDPKNPAVFNNLAGNYGHRGPVTNAFRMYEKAIELDPKEAVYYRNFATVVFLFRRDVMEHYGITNEQQVFDKSLDLYRKAADLAPKDFHVAADLAQTYYGIKPPRHQEAIAAWRKAHELAGDDLEREGVRIHLARILVQAARFAEARTELTGVTNANYLEIKRRIEKTMEAKINGTNAPAP